MSPEVLNVCRKRQQNTPGLPAVDAVFDGIRPGAMLTGQRRDNRLLTTRILLLRPSTAPLEISALARQREYERLEQQMEKAKRELSIAEVSVRALRQFNGAIPLSLLGGIPERNRSRWRRPWIIRTV